MTLTDKYRPRRWDEVVCHAAEVRALTNALKTGSTRAFLFTGPSGVGKTTLARLAAAQVGCKGDLLEIDAATYTGVDEMRAVTATLSYRPLGVGAVKGVIVDEFHAVSKNSAQSLLKILEEPPPWVYWFLCTTDPARILPTIRTRCMVCALKPVPRADLQDLLRDIVDAEQLQLPRGVVELCAHEARGSPRQALANLATCAAVKTIDEARALLRSAEGAPAAFELARALQRGSSWDVVWNLLGQMDDIDPESVRHVVIDYATKAILGRKQATEQGLAILKAFSKPFNHHDGISPVVLACGELFFGDGQSR